MKRHTQLVSVLMVACLTVTNVMGQSVKTPVRPEPKVAIGKLGVGEKAQITVKLKDGAELRGNVSRVGDNDFNITDRKTLQERTVAYDEIVAMKGKESSWDYGARARKEVAKAGTGVKARIDLKTREGARIKGFVFETSGNSFVVANSKTGQMTTLAYGDVDTIHRP